MLSATLAQEFELSTRLHSVLEGPTRGMGEGYQAARLRVTAALASTSVSQSPHDPFPAKGWPTTP